MYAAWPVHLPPSSASASALASSQQLLLTTDAVVTVLGSHTAVCNAVLAVVADTLVQIDTDFGLKLLQRFSELTIPRIEGDTSSSPLHAFVAAALAIASDAFDISGVLKPAGKRQHVVGTPSWTVSVYNALRLIVRRLLCATARLALFETSTGSNPALSVPSAADNNAQTSAASPLPTTLAFLTSSAGEAVMVDSVLTLLLVNECWGYAADSVFATANARTVGAGVVDSTVRAPVLQTSEAHAVTAPSSTASAASVTTCDAVPEQVTAYQRMPFADPTAIRRGSAVMGYYVDAKNPQATGWYAATVVDVYDDSGSTHEFDYRLCYDVDGVIHDVKFAAVGARVSPLRRVSSVSSAGAVAEVGGKRTHGSASATASKRQCVDALALLSQTPSASVRDTASVNAAISAQARQMATSIATSTRTGTPWHDLIMFNQRFRAGWLVKRVLSDFEHRHYSAANHSTTANTVEQQKLALILSLETSTGRVQGPSIKGGPGTNLVVVTDSFVNFLMRVEWYNQTALLRPADFMRYREDVFNHALRYYSTSPVLRDMWSVLLVAANDRLPANRQIGAEASIAVLERVMRVNMLSVQRTHRVGLQVNPDHVHRSALRKGLKVTQPPPQRAAVVQVPAVENSEE